jgi:hypothetical protein
MFATSTTPYVFILRRLVMTKLGFIVLPSAADALSVQAADTKDPLREIGSAIQHLD